MTEKEDLISNFIREKLEDTPNILKDELSSNNKIFNYRVEYEDIIKFIEDFRNGNPTNRFLVLPGLRGVGKTTLLYQVYDYLLSKKINPNQIHYLSCEQLN